MSELAKAYDPRDVEARWSREWEDRGWFVADATSGREPYVIVIPPPNVTGSLHMGHALTNTIQDVLIRWKRMSGYEALWLPGVDHAGIATQMVVERRLAKQGLDRRTMGRDAFLERVWDWKRQSGDRITLQLRRLGSSLDWSRERFTMDPGFSGAVREVFVALYEQGLVYRDERLVNWDPKGQTVLSDLEVEQEEEDGFLWHIAYPVEGSDERLVVATTRPETLLGDVAVAIHPDDPRYTHLHGRSVRLPIADRTIPIVCDPIAARMEFGSGAVKITPGHDFNDFETGRRNQLPMLTVFDREARLNDLAPERLRGLDRYEARKRVLAELVEAGLLVKEEPYRFAPGRSQRTGVIVEPMSVGPQWFVKMEPLSKPALECVRDGRIRFVPESWAKTYFHWMENIRDWCISRQLWWGHRIPAWYCRDCGHATIDRNDPEACAGCGSRALTQDEDVLDTWFSSALWPFATMGWPEKTPDLAKFYPTSVLETGFDILFFWVARMIVMGTHFMGEVPFRTVYLHAMVRDKTGRKMSKSYGNVVDPLHVVDGVRPAELTDEERETYELLFRDFPEGVVPQGADALRFTLAVYAAAGRDIKLDVKRVEGYRAFINKLWNAARFALMNLEGFEARPIDAIDRAKLSEVDRWILTRLSRTAETVQTSLEAFELNEAAQALYSFVWHELCDWYLELAKPTLYGNEDAPGDPDTTRAVLAYVLDRALRLLHPFTPFVTEEIWSKLPRPAGHEPALCVASWPVASEIPRFEEDERDVARVCDLITAIRRVRGESQIAPSTPIPVVCLYPESSRTGDAVRALDAYIRRQARVVEVRVCDASEVRPSPAATTVESGTEIVIPLAGLIDFDAERTRVGKELEKVARDIEHFERKLGNERFVASAPAALVDEARQKLEEAREARSRLETSLARLG